MIDPASYHAAFLAAMTRFEGSLRWKVLVEKNRFVRACAARYTEHGTPNFFDLVGKHKDALFQILGGHYRKVVPVFAHLTAGQIADLQTKNDDALFRTFADEWLNTQGLTRASLIADTTEADVLAAISAGMENGDGIDAISRAIRGVTGLSAFRSDLIARTETHAAANYAGIETARTTSDSLGVDLMKVWLPTLDNRTRTDHADMAGSDPIPLDAKFIVGGEAMDRPGDPSASAAQICNCRCTLIYQEANN